MQPHIVEFLREVLNHDEVPEDVKADAIELMLRELGGGGPDVTGKIDKCICLPNGRYIPVEAARSISREVVNSNKIAAIKEYRFVTNEGLKDSKDFIEDHWDELAKGEY